MDACVNLVHLWSRPQGGKVPSDQLSDTATLIQLTGFRSDSSQSALDPLEQYSNQRRPCGVGTALCWDTLQYTPHTEGGGDVQL